MSTLLRRRPSPLERSLPHSGELDKKMVDTPMQLDQEGGADHNSDIGDRPRQIEETIVKPVSNTAAAIRRKPLPPKRAPLPDADLIETGQETTRILVNEATVHSHEDLEKAAGDLISNEFQSNRTVLEEGEVRPDLDVQLDSMELETLDDDHSDPILWDHPIAEEPASPGNGSRTSKSAKFRHAVGEIKHFAGGVIARPFEATKHFAVLRHGNALVWFKGPATSVAITVFSDTPLPPDRTLWLQKKGFCGKTGLKIGTKLGNRSAWIDVTPTIHTTADTLPKADERAWQRDIQRFVKKTKENKKLDNHRAYETDVVRIPYAAEDGYFRVVICSGSKVLCPSPIFRYASSSLDPSVLRGASLSTLPLELGVAIGTMVGRNTAKTAVMGTMQPALTTVRSISQTYQPTALTQFVANTAYSVSGAESNIQKTVESVNESYDEKRKLELSSTVCEPVEMAHVVGSDDGPEPPFPIRFSARCKDRVVLGIPTMTLTNVPEETLLRLSGVYMGWTLIASPKNYTDVPDDVFDVWHQAVVIVRRAMQRQATTVPQKEVLMYICYDCDHATLLDSKVNLMLMGFVRTLESDPLSNEPQVELQHSQVLSDIATTTLSLSRPSWSPETTLERINSASSAASLKDRAAGIRHAGQQQFDKLQIYRLGVRTDSMALKDQLIGNGGLCVRR